MPPPRVVFADAYPHLRGGAQQLTRLLGRHLMGSGMRPRLVVPGLGPTAWGATADGIPTTVVPAGPSLSRYGGTTRGWRLVPALASLPGFWLRARRAFDGARIAHINDHRGMVLFAPAARLAGLPVVFHRHTLNATAGMDAACVAAADAVIVPSERHRRQVPGGRTRCWVVPGVTSGAHRRRQPADNPLIATVARLHPLKGIDLLLAAMARLRAVRPDVRLVIVGGADPAQPAYHRRLRELVAAHDLADAVTFRGHLDDPWQVARTAWVYVQPSRTETQGLALREAMTMGLPVVASDIGVFRDVVDDGRTGLLIPPEDPVALGAALEGLLVDRERADRLGSEAAAVDSGPSVHETVDAVTAVYRQLLRNEYCRWR